MNEFMQHAGRSGQKNVEAWLADMTNRVVHGKAPAAEEWKRLERWVANDQFRLERLPDCLKTKAVCLAGVSAGGQALGAVPKAMRTAEVCRAAVESGIGAALKFVPEAMKTPELCLRAVQIDGCQLYDVPEDLRTEEVCLAAVLNHGDALQDVPGRLRTERLCFKAVLNRGEALEFVPERLRSEKICLAAAAMSGDAIHWVPKDLQTEEFLLQAGQIRAAVRRNGPEIFKAIWQDMADPEPAVQKEASDGAARGRFLYISNDADPSEPGCVVDLESASWARSCLLRLDSINAWLESTDAAALKSAPQEIREAAFKPEISLFNFAAVKLWEMKDGMKKAGDRPLASTGRPFDMMAFAQLLTEDEAKALLNIESEDCIEPGEYGSRSFFTNGAVCFDAPRSETPDRDGFNFCSLALEDMRQMLDPLVQAAEAEDMNEMPRPQP